MDYIKLPVEVRVLNRLLVDHFGVDTITTKPIWRVAWSNDQFEKILSAFTDAGIELLQSEVMEKRKYPFYKDCWLLERLVLVPEIHHIELPDVKQSYECMWNFRHKDGKPLVPSFEACKFVVDAVYAALGKKSLHKYVDPESADPVQAKIERVNRIMDELYGDESSLGLKTVTGEAVGFTTTKIMEN